MDAGSAPTFRPNRWVLVASDSTAQLTYTLQTDPAPLTVSLPSADPVLASFQFVITNRLSKDVVVTYLAFTFQVGDAATALTARPSNEIKWVVSDSQRWQITPPPSPVTSGPAVFTLGPATGSSVTIAAGTSIAVEFYQIAANFAVGATSVSLKEIADGQAGFTSFEVTKFPYGFYFEGLVATVASGSTFVPVAQVAHGASVTLLWNGSVVDASAYKVYYATNEGQQAGTVKTNGEWTSPPLARDTVFTVVVTMSAVGGQPLTYALSVAVAVQQQDVLANSLATVGSLKAGGSLTAAGAATIDGDTEVKGMLTAASAKVTGSASVANGLTVGNATDNATSPPSSSAPVLLVKGDTSITGLTSVGSLSVSGSALLGETTISGQLAADGNVCAMGDPASAGEQGMTYQATTDGFLVGHVYNNRTSMNVGQMWGSCNGVYVEATGGNPIYFIDSNGSHTLGINNQSFMLPVPANQPFSFGSYTYGIELPPTFQFWWIPFGVGTVQKVDTAEVAAPDPPQAFDLSQTELQQGRRELLGELIEELLADESGGQLERLARALKKIDGEK